MPVVTVQMWEGRTVDQKRKMATAITNALVEHGNMRPDGLHVIFQEIPVESWARAGVLGCDRTDHPKPGDPEYTTS